MQPRSWWRLQKRVWMLTVVGTIGVAPFIMGASCKVGNVALCKGGYLVIATYKNTSTSAVHLFASTEQMGADNKLESGTEGGNMYSGRFFDDVEYPAGGSGPTDAQRQLCDSNIQAARAADPQTWTFYAGQSGQVIATVTMTVTYDETAVVAQTDREVRCTVTWNGSNLTVTKQ